MRQERRAGHHWMPVSSTPPQGEPAGTHHRYSGAQCSQFGGAVYCHWRLGWEGKVSMNRAIVWQGLLPLGNRSTPAEVLRGGDRCPRDHTGLTSAQLERMHALWTTVMTAAGCA